MLLPPRSKNRKHFRNPCMSLPNRILLTPFCPSSKYSDFCSHCFLAFVCSFTLSVHIFKQHLFLSSFQLCIQEITFSALLSSFNFMFVRFMHVVYTSVIFSSNLGLIRFLPITQVVSPCPWCGSIEGFPSFSIITPSNSLSPEDALCFCSSLCLKPGISSYLFMLTYSLTAFSRYNKSVFFLCSITLYFLT